MIVECVYTSSLAPRTGGWFTDWLPAWKPTSESQLEAAERTILSCKYYYYYTTINVQCVMVSFSTVHVQSPRDVVCLPSPQLRVPRPVCADSGGCGDAESGDGA